MLQFCYPTETTVISTSYQFELGQIPVLLGRLCANTRIYMPGRTLSSCADRSGRRDLRRRRWAWRGGT